MHPDECLYCPTCSDIREVEVPECIDGPAGATSERACVVCGAGLFVDPVTPARRTPARAA